jgi:hypothetical protein
MFRVIGEHVMANANRRFGFLALAIMTTAVAVVVTVAALAHQTNPHADSARAEALTIAPRPQAAPTSVEEFTRFLESWTSMAPGSSER